MTGFPTRITHDQKLAVLQALGLPAKIVTGVHMSATDGVSVTVQVRDDKGQRLAQDDGEVLTAVLHLPYDYSDGGTVNAGTGAEPDATVNAAAPAPDADSEQATADAQHRLNCQTCRAIEELWTASAASYRHPQPVFPQARVFHVDTGVELGVTDIGFQQAVQGLLRPRRTRG